MYAVAGLFVSVASSLSMLPLYSRMDPRGKAANAAFAATGAFVFGGQLAFVSSVSTGNVVAAYVACKLVGGILAVWLASILQKGTNFQQKEPRNRRRLANDVPLAAHPAALWMVFVSGGRFFHTSSSIKTRPVPFGAGRRFLSVSFSRIQLHCLVLPKENGMPIFIVARNGTSLYLFLPFFDFFKDKKQLRRNFTVSGGNRCLDHTPPERKAVRSPLPDPVLILIPAKQNSPCVLPGGISNIPWNRIADSYPCCIRIQSRHNTFPLDSFVPRLQSNCV